MAPSPSLEELDDPVGPADVARGRPVGVDDSTGPVAPGVVKYPAGVRSDVMNRAKLIAVIAIVALVAIALLRRRGGGEDDEYEFEE